MSIVETERVLVIPTAAFNQVGYFQGFSNNIQPYLDELLQSVHVSFRPRGEMESDPSFKQLIPYAIFRYVDTDGVVHVFQYRRGSGQGEKRLHKKRSVGIGGHISSVDSESTAHADTYRQGMLRELEEEVIVEGEYFETCVGLINDDLTEVGKVHLGVVHILDVESPCVRPRETDICEAGFINVETLRKELDQFESWSAICLEALFGKAINR
jgi:predicted NUDIX family phosphoesterase